MSPKREPVTEDRLRNFKYFGKILPLLDRLHDAGTARDRAGNRLLHFDQYIALQLLFFFNRVLSANLKKAKGSGGGLAGPFNQAAKGTPRVEMARAKGQPTGRGRPVHPEGRPCPASSVAW